jgi:predicted DNA-binding ArsR family transcriptional regulator
VAETLSEEELIETEEETIEASESAEETEEEIPLNIDVNAALLEAMVKRTEILEKLAEGKIDAGKALQELEAVLVPTATRKRRRRK